MIIFKINFNYQESEYSADIQKIPLVNNLPVQWHAFNITPSILNAPNPYMFIHDPHRNIITCELFNNSTDLPNAILNSIKKHCLEYGISIVG